MLFLKEAVTVSLIVASLAVAAPLAPTGFDFTGPTTRVVTPNGDGFNDAVFFRFANPRDSAGTIRLYDLRGRHLRDLAINVGDTSESWDARVDGRIVDSGIYIYVLTVERRTYSGAVLVVR